jgi:C-terminal processing protease CtpA/Prc
MAIRSALRAAIVAASIGAQVSAQPAATPMDPRLIESTVEALAQVIRREYFDVALAAKVEQALETASAEGRYASAATREALAERLTADLYGVTHDKHLTVALTRPRDATPPDGGPARARRDQPTDAGFRRVAILDGNVGYLDLTMFLRPAEHRDALAAAMQTLRTADALILDMRDNGGGSPATVALLISYLFDEPALPLFEVSSRSGDVERYSTEPASAGIERNGTRPLWVLTSRRTFSGGEGLAFLLQERQRAQVVGERTAGAANPGRPYPVNALFEVTVPNGRVRSAIKLSNWEGDGVMPDVSAPATEALDIALDRARQDLRKRKAP